MRVTVNLSLFFHDHRCSAKLFINENLKTVNDLENRLCEIFNISDFYLKCDNQYLPPSEDIHVLNNNDIVWAFPKTDNPLLNESSLALNSVEIEEHEKSERKAKKTKRKKSNHKELNEDDNVVEITPHKKHKKRRREREENPESHLQNVEGAHATTKKRKKSRIKEEEISLNTAADTVSKDSGRDTCDSNKSDEVESRDPTISVRSLVDSFENKKEMKKCIENSFTPVLPKKFNIVKTIIVSHNKLDIQTPNTSVITNDSKMSVSVNETLTSLETSLVNNETHNEDEQATGGKVDILNSTIETDTRSYRKKKRKRSRNKRTKINENCEMSSSEKSNDTLLAFVPHSSLAKGGNDRHVRFKENSEVIQTALNDSATDNKDKVNNTEQCLTTPVDNTDLSKVINNNEITEEFIMKQPPMKHIQPRTGDIIAFMIIRISENYTPEVSTRIIGKVTNYDLEKSEVTFSLLYGQDQCTQPRGKFSIDLNGEEETSAEQIDNTYRCTWSNVLDPRLLYP